MIGRIFKDSIQAIRDYMRRRRGIRPEVMRHLEDSIEKNRELGRRLAK